MPIDGRKVVLANGKDSTISGRTEAVSPDGLVLAGLRLGMRTLAAVAPGIAARVAAQLWFRPPRPRVHPAAREFMQTGARSTIQVHGRPVAVWTWGSGPVVLLVHGWGGYGGQMQAFVLPLVRAGYQPVIFDAPAHGESGPSQLGSHRTTLFDFAYVIDAIARDRGDLAGIVAHSGGSTAAAWALLGAEWKVRRMVFLAPMASPMAYLRIFHEALGLNDDVRRRLMERTSRRFGFTWEELEVPAMASRTVTPPLLVVHDRADTETSWAEGKAIVDAWPNSILETTEGLGHRRILRDAGVIEAVTGFVAQG